MPKTEPWRTQSKQALPPLRAEDCSPEEFERLHAIRSSWHRLPVSEFRSRYAHHRVVELEKAIGSDNLRMLLESTP